MALCKDKYIDRSGSCWIWTGQKKRNGYGYFIHSGKYISAHRWMYEQTYGPFDTKLYVLHHCDNPPCVNPEHLFLGTQTDNMKDRSVKGRFNQSGEKNPNWKGGKTRDIKAYMRAWYQQKRDHGSLS